mmetsp:Transcript_2301/g.5206  ORF Transcript_2301/g.5206 Transcript_2301/m.5206 type:complete len:255 (+) Transcript_2301:436-1200(+)
MQKRRARRSVSWSPGTSWRACGARLPSSSKGPCACSSTAAGRTRRPGTPLSKLWWATSAVSALSPRLLRLRRTPSAVSQRAVASSTRWPSTRWRAWSRRKPPKSRRRSRPHCPSRRPFPRRPSASGPCPTARMRQRRLRRAPSVVPGTPSSRRTSWPRAPQMSSRRGMPLSVRSWRHSRRSRSGAPKLPRPSRLRSALRPSSTCPRSSPWTSLRWRPWLLPRRRPPRTLRWRTSSPRPRHPHPRTATRSACRLP